MKPEKEFEELLKAIPPFKKRPKKSEQLKPKPAKLICVDGKIIADAVVVVSHSDPNWYRRNGYKAYLTGDVVTVKVPIVRRA
jgi:hypothetical protein